MSTEALAAFRTAEVDPDPFSGLVGAERYFNAACDAGEVAPLTLDGNDLALAPEDEAARIAAVRDRLRRLGYSLPDVPAETRGLWADDVKEALRQFQIEAVLVERAGELTVESWDALQALFNFETRFQAADWFGADGATLTLRRAVRLRLSVFGFGAPPAPEDFEPKAEAIDAFSRTARELGILNTPEDSGAALTPEFAGLLFDHDALTDRLADCGGRLEALRGKACSGAEHFLVCFAKIELWLHGYDVAPDGSGKLIQPGMHGRHGGGNTARTNRTADQFNLFFAELAPEGVSVKSASPAAIPARVPELLKRMREMRAAQPLAKDSASHEVVALLEDQLAKSPGLWAELKATAAKLVGILFDGVRRVIAWIGRLFKRVWSAVSTVAVNIWRAVHHFMGGAAFYFRKATRALVEGVGFLTAPGLASAPVCCAGYSRKRDFDAAVLIDASADETEVGIFARGLAHKGAVLAVACRIIRLVCTAVRIALGGAGGAIGGFVPMVLGLASAWSQLRELGRMLDALPEEA
jgi:hypothetical protein